ncbi:MAG: ABC transporter permease [Chloroflexota bacterium]|nr:ABC transporter permease [Chloroflexota bacterium]
MRRRDILLASGVLLLVWQVVAMVLDVEVLPTPIAVFGALVEEIPQGLGRHFLVSGSRVVVSIIIAVLFAVPVAIALAQSPSLDRLVSPFITILYPIPKIVFLPIILLILGIGNVSKVFIISLILFFQILVVVRDDAQALREEQLYSVRSLGAGRLALFRFVYLPATLPATLTAVRVSIGTAIAVLFFAESFATTSGLGYYIIVESWGRLAYPEMYAGVVAMSVLGVLLYFIVDGLERRLCPWARRS